MVSQQTANVARRAKEFYELRLRTSLEATNRDDFVAIEPESGDYFIGESLSEAIQSSRAAHPDRLAFAIRIGHSVAVNIGVLTPRLVWSVNPIENRGVNRRGLT
jgi:hypothetical protein